MGAAEIGRLLGVSRQRVQQIIKDRAKNSNGEHFPDAAVALDMGKTCRAENVREWAKDYAPRQR